MYFAWYLLYEICIGCASSKQVFGECKFVYTDEGSVYIAGDTALTEDMKIIPKTCPKLDLAILPIGDNFTMGYEDALVSSEYINCERILGYHFDETSPQA